MKKVFLILCMLFVNVQAKLNLIAIIHPQCHHCEKWLSDWQDGEIKSIQGMDMPEVIVKKITDFDDVNWIMEKLSWRSGPTPTFVLMSPDFSTEYDRFSGYSDWKSFESELSKAIRSIPEKNKLEKNK